MNTYKFIDAEKVNYTVRALCRALDVSRSAFYAWRAKKTNPCRRGRADELLATHIRAIHKGSRGTYGSPRIHAQLSIDGWSVSRKRVIRLMKTQGLQARKPRRWKTTTVADSEVPPAPNILNRDFTAPAPNRVWVADITYVSTVQGWLYVAAILDLFSRRVVGWSAASHMRTDLVLDAWNHAVARRTPEPGLVFHTDQGSRATDFDQPWRNTAQSPP